MAKKSKSKSDKSEDTKSHGTVAAVSTTLKTDAPVDPLLASLFEKSVSSDLRLQGNA
jgi:nucleolar protein 12